MANLQTTVRGRHDWVEGYREVRGLGVRCEVLKCGNCAKTHDMLNGDPPVGGCFSDIKLRNLGPSMQKDQLERDLRQHLYGGDR
jgi:hypothetical protein